MKFTLLIFNNHLELPVVACVFTAFFKLLSQGKYKSLDFKTKVKRLNFETASRRNVRNEIQHKDIQLENK